MGAIILAADGIVADPAGDRSGATGTGGGYEEATATGTALNNPPKDVRAQVTDNDDIAEQTSAAIAGCRATTLFQYADSQGTAGGQQTTEEGCSRRSGSQTITATVGTPEGSRAILYHQHVA